MAEPLEIIHKLIALALHNPNEEEARSAAYRAVEMIMEHQIPIGGKTAVNRAPTLTPEEQGEFQEILSALMTRKNPDGFTPSTYHQDFDIDDGFMKKRIIDAWRKLREERKRFEAEIHVYEMQTHRKFERL